MMAGGSGPHPTTKPIFAFPAVLAHYIGENFLSLSVLIIIVAVAGLEANAEGMRATIPLDVSRRFESEDKRDGEDG
ncbi:hypothetical protein P0O24_06890 [Methanotrichaceae archaeon M04Ac]|uniref:Uncharacterized protein n=1 Tax=Candidatus Methanocrinis alkalitolerans TaxID=3033395 RepID=A0ABT5XF74_9EURY|nr:hypothetical protein [Candidatus Methanocrinis alkalitolerans]